MYEKKVSSDREEGKTNIQPEKVFSLIPTNIKVFVWHIYRWAQYSKNRGNYDLFDYMLHFRGARAQISTKEDVFGHFWNGNQIQTHPGVPKAVLQELTLTHPFIHPGIWVESMSWQHIAYESKTHPGMWGRPRACPNSCAATWSRWVPGSLALVTWNHALNIKFTLLPDLKVHYLNFQTQTLFSSNC